MGNILNIINSDEHFYNLSEDCKENYMECLDGPFMSKEVKEHFSLTIVNVDSINENKKYIYPIECKTIDAVFSGLNHIPQKVMDMVNKDKCKVIFSYESEGDFPNEDFNEWFYKSKFILKEKIKLSNVYIFSNDFNAKKRNNTEINFFPSTHFLDTISYQLNEIVTNDNGHLDLWDFKYNFQFKTIYDIDIENKSKHFLSYLRNCVRPHRRALAAYFEHYDLWDKNIISFLKVSWGDKDDICEYLPRFLKQAESKLNDRDIVEIDTQHLESKMGFNTIFSSKWEHYQDTFLSVVSETCYEQKSIYMSEKILKPIINLHPFIVFSTPYFLGKLHDLGFKTFAGFIDESYDDELNPQRRLMKIFAELDKFRNKTNDELKYWWSDILPVLEHNQKRLLELGQQKTDKIKLLENLYD